MSWLLVAACIASCTEPGDRRILDRRQLDALDRPDVGYDAGDLGSDLDMFDDISGDTMSDTGELSDIDATGDTAPDVNADMDAD